MSTSRILTIEVLALLILLLDGLQKAPVNGWSNGGSSDYPSDVKYGTHDWIAEHALDWLPSNEKHFIVNNLNDYLYGTELPDNGTAPGGGIGDKTKHHVYYFADGSLQDNASAVRAQTEYNNAVTLYQSGYVANATKKLGVVTHYISDLASFGHVMGNKTDWGNATQHNNYEGYVDPRTDNYADNFISLTYDGVLDSISAYDAALELAFDTTFDAGETYTCVWMEHNYDWDDPAFRNRCEESIDLAVNLLADVLHTFYLEAVVPEFPTILIVPVFMVLVTLVLICVKKAKRSTWLTGSDFSDYDGFRAT
jgi:hypothetical protein